MVKNIAVKNFSLKKDELKNSLLFDEGYNVSKDVLLEVNDLGNLSIIYHFFSDINKKLVKIESV